MVKTNGKNLIIEMPDTDVANDVQALQRDIINAIQCFNYKDFGNTNGCPFLMLLELLTATLPTYHELQHITEFRELARNSTPETPELKTWVSKQISIFNNANKDF